MENAPGTRIGCWLIVRNHATAELRFLQLLMIQFGIVLLFQNLNALEVQHPITAGNIAENLDQIVIESQVFVTTKQVETLQSLLLSLQSLLMLLLLLLPMLITTIFKLQRVTDLSKMLQMDLVFIWVLPLTIGVCNLIVDTLH